ncbi:venom factor-like [Varanus komodoensis]|uniref:venom factor-like n=1 Tax=Varanus komodoensis TaxID=61221 RepID=UPI001CF78964|nr:venom factor-like [Varanus komodoensis]XP_044299554.1 venom factor-like [Varanus komodoensis]XP_044299555.1 venom factor-like [Varanus komodoensis]XP_044299556.1 venom factor-like [Varanus komodoensis]
MEGTAFYFVVTLVIAFPAASHSQLYSLITPNVLWVDSEEKVVVEAHGLSSPTEIVVTVYTFPEKSNVLFMVRATLDQGNGMMATPIIKVSARNMKMNSKKRQYVVVQASCPQFTLEKVVLVSFQDAYIFIQTDQPVYTPGSFVRCRVFSVNQNLESVKKRIIVDFQTPEGFLVSHNVINSGDMRLNYEIPEIVSLGTWKIIARGEISPQQTFITQFEVRELVLPSFEVILEPSEKVFYVDDERDFTVHVTARFHHGGKLDGTAFVLFGVNMDNMKTDIPDSLQRIPVTHGAGKAVLSRAMLRTRFHNLSELIGHSLSVFATVMTKYGNNMVVTEQISIAIVTTPYEIHFTKTSKYFKPGMSYELMVYVTNPDGSPAPLIPVTAELVDITESGSATTQSDGTARIILNIPQDIEELRINVKTNHALLPKKRQARASIVATAYETQEGSGNYLHIERITTGQVKAGDVLHVRFIMNNQDVQTQYFTYIILSKGKVIKAGRLPRASGQNMASLPLHITLELIPSFWIVAYYQVGNREIVADSLWVDVKDSCMGTLVVKGAAEAVNQIHEPRGRVRLTLEGDPRARVGLVAIDKRIYTLYQKQRLNQTKIWDAVERSDIGCTAGSGRNSVAVFADAGLTLVTNQKIATLPRMDPKCPQPARRRSRSIQFTQLKESEGDFEEGFMALHYCSTEYPWSWLWNTEQLPPNNQGISSKVVYFYLKDSIATWEVLAVSISGTKGICVAEPYEIRVRTDFFIDLQLPYSVVKNEQVELRAILYNYLDQDIRVLVELVHNKAFCSASSAKKNYRQIFTVKGQSTRLMPIVIIPLQLGLHDIALEAITLEPFMSFHVCKKLNIQPEGKQRKLVNTFELDPIKYGTDGIQELRISATDLKNIVPDTEHMTQIFITGNPVIQPTEDYIDGTKLDKLIITPNGNVEQNIITMTPLVSATYFLDKTELWEKIGVDRRPYAIEQINKGYNKQLSFRQADHSYRPVGGSRSSTWLTAYTVKVYTMASMLLRTGNIDDHCGPVKWLILERQKPDGTFYEEATVQATSMLGGNQYGEPKVSLTAFVVVTLLESREICKNLLNNLETSISKASDYLLRNYESLDSPHTIVLTSYALALAGRLDNEGVLMRASTDRNRWEDRNSYANSIEATSYAMLALLAMKKFDHVDAVAKWLKAQNYYGGTFRKIQAIIIMFQALAHYEIDMPSSESMSLEVTVQIPHTYPVFLRFHDESALVTRTVETHLNQDFTVKAAGQGRATVTVTTVYYTKLQEEAAQCRNFTLQVSVEEIPLSIMEASGAIGAIRITICTRYLGQVDAPMTVIDVSMLAGFVPDPEDLRKLSEGVGRYINRSEIDNVLSERDNFLLYLDKLSHTEDECFQFKAYKYNEVDPIQPGSVQVYNYYALDKQCTKFYHPHTATVLPNNICHGNVCWCKVESCCVQKESISLQQRVKAACKSEVNYVYKTRMIETEEINSYKYFIMEVLEFFKARDDINPHGNWIHKFISPMKCKESLHLEENKDYLIWGLGSDTWHTNNELNYYITKDTWIEKWPDQKECQEEEYQALCNDLVEFSSIMTFSGCQG